jgi:hypothetical protein
MLYQVTISGRSKNLMYLEACLRAYIDGSKQPLLLSSGTEDYFLSAYYFASGLYHMENAGATHFDRDQGAFSAYKFHDNDPIFFEKGFRLVWRNCEDYQCPSSYASLLEYVPRNTTVNNAILKQAMIQKHKTIYPELNNVDMAPVNVTSYVWVYQY